MSAYVVEHQTIQRVLNGLRRVFHQGDRLWVPVTAPQVVQDWLQTPTGDTEKALGQTLLNLNCQSVEERYGAGEAASFGVSMIYEPCEVQKQTNVGLYKTLSCYLYQACEGKAGELPLFQYLEALKKALAETIVETLPEWETATWG